MWDVSRSLAAHLLPLFWWKLFKDVFLEAANHDCARQQPIQLFVVSAACA